MKDIYIQIGANIGYDYFFNLIKELKEPCKIILIEPNPNLIERLTHCYKNLSKIHDINILNVGISYDSNNVLHTYRGDDDAVLSSILNRKSHPYVIDNIKFSVMTFDEVCIIYNCINIKLLCIDTEGYDYWILKNIDIKKYNIETIECEYWPYDIDCTEEIKTGPKFFANEILPKYSKFYNISKCTRDSMDTYIFLKNLTISVLEL